MIYVLTKLTWLRKWSCVFWWKNPLNVRFNCTKLTFQIVDLSRSLFKFQIHSLKIINIFMTSIWISTWKLIRQIFIIYLFWISILGEKVFQVKRWEIDILIKKYSTSQVVESTNFQIIEKNWIPRWFLCSEEDSTSCEKKKWQFNWTISYYSRSKIVWEW